MRSKVSHLWHLRGVLLAAVLLTVPACRAVRYRSLGGGQIHLQEARLYEEQELPDSALAAFGLALEENPKLVKAHMGMADIYRQWGNHQLAHRGYENAVALAPNQFEPHYYLGLMKQLLGRVKEALAVYLRALALRPDSFKANHHLASAYLQLGRASEAVPYAQRAIELNGNHQGAWANLATSHSMTQQHEQAIHAYRRAVELGDPAEPVLLGLADAHVRVGRFERAVVVLRNQIRRKASALAYERLGYCQFKLRQFDDALASFRAALSIDKDDTAALNGLGVCLMTLYIQSGRKYSEQSREALNSWRRSVQLRPNQPHIIDLISRYRRI